jgi:hypothetical protein
MDVADTNASTGFALSRVLPGTPAEVFDHFTNPALFSYGSLFRASPHRRRA